MILKAVIAKLDDVDEKYRDLYVEKDKKWVLQVDGIRTQADIEVLQRGNKQEREAHAKTKADLKTATDKLEAFGELDPEKVQEALSELETLKAAGPNKTAEEIKQMVDDRVAAREAKAVEKATTKLAKDLSTATETIKTLTNERDSLASQGVQRTIDDAVRHAAATAKVLDTAVPDALIHARSEFEIVEGKVQTKDGKTPDEWVEARKGVSGHWWPQSQGAGARGNVSDLQAAGGTNPFTTEGWNLTKQGELLKGDPTRAARLAEAAGVPKNDSGAFIWGQKPPAKAA